MEKMPLHDILCDILGNRNCYFVPPADAQIQYPCIIYEYVNDIDIFADNCHYVNARRYTVTIIDEDPDSKIPKRLIDNLPYCVSDRNFATEGLSHFVYTLYYSGPRIKEVNEYDPN